MSKPNPNPSSSQLETLTLKFPIPWSPSDPQSDPNLQSKLLSKLNSSFQKLKSSQFHAQFLSQFQSPLFRSALGKLLSLDPQSRQFQFVIYGIGSIDSDESPRLQLSLARVIYEHFKTQISSIEVFDPVISAVECTVIEELGITVLRKDEGGRREYPDIIDSYLRLAAIGKERNDIQLSIALIGDALNIADKCPNALSMLGSLELTNDDWDTAKDTFCTAKDAKVHKNG